MIIQRGTEEEIRPDQVRAMAHGVYYLAGIDGITEKERELIASFLKEGGVDLDPDSLAKIPFSLEELLYSLDTVFLRKTFLKVCVLMAQADGTVSDAEMAELRRVAQALGVDEPLDALIAELEGTTLS
ncbi:MAG: TerB family tellurite resistance protein [Deltaproteobacteria bacterium]